MAYTTKKKNVKESDYPHFAETVPHRAGQVAVKGSRIDRTTFNGDNIYKAYGVKNKKAAKSALENRRETVERTKRNSSGSGKALASEMKFAKASNSQRETYRRSPYEVERVTKLADKDAANVKRENRQRQTEAAKKKSTSTAKKSTKTATAKKATATKTKKKKEN